MAVRAPVPDEEALIREHLGLVHWYVARHPARRLADMDDMLAAGREGLLRAVRTYDPAAGFSFSTYATRCIQNTVHKHLRSWYGNAETRPGRRRLRAAHVSWDTPIGDGITRAELIPDQAPTVETLALGAYGIEPALEALAGLTTDPRHFQVLRWLAEGWSQQWIARQLGVAPNTIRNWLRHWSRSRVLHDALLDAA